MLLHRGTRGYSGSSRMHNKECRQTVWYVRARRCSAMSKMLKKSEARVQIRAFMREEEISG
jgi:hypothetical protein